MCYHIVGNYEMNFIKLFILLGISFAINLLISPSIDISIDDSHQHIVHNFNLKGELPDAYSVKILFQDDNYKHHHTVNGGYYQIDVHVKGETNFLSIGNVNQIDCNLNCNIYSYFANSNLFGNINIERTITVVGNKEESEMKEMLRNDIVDIILQQIQEI
jgi:hypothetical protein